MRSRRIALAGLAAVLAVSAVPMAQASTGDRDRDRMPDRWERSHGLSPGYDDSARDPDRGRLSNYREYRSGTDPRKRDRDGVRDAYEDSDDNGVRNRDERNGSHERHSDRNHRSDDRHESHDDHGDDDDHDD